ncbi:MAG: nitroreductase family protein, partial [Actinomycetota bacterium]|nr:nitroreductase family protein [Actinomycetota bacterium]
GIEPIGSLTQAQVQAALLAATAAPSLHNSQPWQLRCTSSSFELHADLSREMRAADPDHREMFVACGAALLNLRLAVRALGIAAHVHLMPDPLRPILLALISPGDGVVPTAGDAELATAIFRRHTNRHPFLDEPVAEVACHRLRQAARTEQSWFAVVPNDMQAAVRTMLAAAHRLQLADPELLAEWQQWTGRNPGLDDGMATTSGGLKPEQQDPWVMRDFPDGQQQERIAGKDFESGPMVAVIGSLDDNPLAQLKAGQAMQRVLLSATADGLSALFLSQVVEIPETRRELRDLIGDGLWPQAVLRLGYGTPATSTVTQSSAAGHEPRSGRFQEMTDPLLIDMAPSKPSTLRRHIRIACTRRIRHRQGTDLHRPANEPGSTRRYLAALGLDHRAAAARVDAVG